MSDGPADEDHAPFPFRTLSYDGRAIVVDYDWQESRITVEISGHTVEGETAPGLTAVFDLGSARSFADLLSMASDRLLPLPYRPPSVGGCG